MLDKLLLNQSTNSHGAMLVRLLVLGGLSSLAASIASSSAYSQQSLPGQFEARKYIGIINYAQKSYYRKNHRFAYQLGQLNTGIPEQTDYYTYVITPTKGYSSTQDVITVQARPLPTRPYIKAVIGGVIALKTSSTTSLTSNRCVATLSPAQGGPSGSQFINVTSAGSLRCPEGYQQIKGVQ
jgi:hypothetical protein